VPPRSSTTERPGSCEDPLTAMSHSTLAPAATRHPRHVRRAAVAWRPLAAVALALVLAACSSGTTPASTFAPGATLPPAPSGSLGSRPSSPAMVEIEQPTAGEVVTGNTVHIVLKLTGATITTVTSTNISPTEGHLHLYVDNVLVSMNYGLTQDLPVQPGTYVLKAEFVAADHYPFNPRVWSPEVFFTVK